MNILNSFPGLNLVIPFSLKLILPWGNCIEFFIIDLGSSLVWMLIELRFADEALLGCHGTGMMLSGRII